MTVLAGIDVGTSSVKGVAIDEGGALLAQAESAYAVSRPAAGWSEQDPALWWRAAQEVLGRLPAGRAIGVTGQMHGLVLLDGRRRPLRPAILWNDQRTAAECEWIEQRVGGERLIELAGNRALTGFTAPKLLWVRRHEPELWRQAAHVMLPKDYVRMKLTGTLACDVSDASGTLLFDVGRREWSEPLLAALEIPAQWLPPALESARPAGETRDGAVVAAGAGDQAAGALGVGVTRPETLSVVLGTSGVVFAVLPRYAADPRGTVHTFCHALPGSWHAMGVALTAGGALAWLQENVASGAPADRLMELAGQWPPGCEGLRFAPYLAGERTPHADPDVRGAFAGLDLRHDLGAMTRAVLEGVAYALRDSLELLRGLGIEPRAARLSGGGGRGRLWPEIVASVLGLPLEIPATESAAAFGAALLGGAAAGVFADVEQACRDCVRTVATVEPVPAWEEAYDDGYARFRRLYPALRAL